MLSTEEMILQNCEENQFKARKLDPKLFENDSCNIGIPKIKPKPLTIPQSMKLRTKQRALLYAKYGSYHNNINNNENFGNNHNVITNLNFKEE